MSQLNEQLISAIKLIADEKKIPRDAVADALKESICKAYVKEYPEEIINVEINIDDTTLNVYRQYTVVDESEELNDYCEISLQDAKDYYKHLKINKEVKLGDVINQPIQLDKLPKKIVNHIKQIFKQGITVQANNEIYNEWKNRVGEIIYAEVEKDDHGIFVNLGNDQYGFMSTRDSIPNEKLIPGHKYNFLIKEVKQQSSGWPIILSRGDEKLVKELLTLEVPEIQEKIIEIVDIARVPGFKTKVALISHQPGVEPCGSVIGARGSRIQIISNAICGERIEVIEYSDNFESYLIDVCAPALIKGYKIISEETPEHKKQLIIVVPGDQLALLIGKKGQNIQLVAKLLKADVDVKTPEDAKYEDLQYTHLEIKSLKQRKFDRILEKNHMGNDYSLNRFNKPTRELLNSTPINSSENSSSIKNTNKTSNKSSNIHSASALLDKIDNFNYDQNSSTHTEVVNKPVENKKDILEQLKTNEQGRQQSSSSNNLELNIDKPTVKKQPKQRCKSPKSKTSIQNSSTKNESILEQFKDLDTKSILNELSQENENRQEEDELDSNYDYDEK
ncbi:MAG: transcription termination factor NusA [Mycoplasma sp.]|nr:transcription termination factor NusA [Mycoplasma sp.]